MKARRDLSSEISWFNQEEKKATRPGRNVKAIEMCLIKFSMEFAQRAFTEQGFSLNSLAIPADCAGQMLSLVQYYMFIYGHYTSTAH